MKCQDCETNEKSSFAKAMEKLNITKKKVLFLAVQLVLLAFVLCYFPSSVHIFLVGIAVILLNACFSYKISGWVAAVIFPTPFFYSRDIIKLEGGKLTAHACYCYIAIVMVVLAVDILLKRRKRKAK